MNTDLPNGSILQILEDGRWIDCVTRATTYDGMVRVYKRMCKENPSGAPYGMRISTTQFEHLGRFIGSEWKTNTEKS